MLMYRFLNFWFVYFMVGVIVMCGKVYELRVGICMNFYLDGRSCLFLSCFLIFVLILFFILVMNWFLLLFFLVLVLLLLVF